MKNPMVPFKWVNGTKYIGDWKFGIQNGQGTVTWTNGINTSVEEKMEKLMGKEPLYSQTA